MQPRSNCASQVKHLDMHRLCHAPSITVAPGDLAAGLEGTRTWALISHLSTSEKDQHISEEGSVLQRQGIWRCTGTA